MLYPRLLCAMISTALLPLALTPATRAAEPMVAVSRAIPVHAVLAKAKFLGRQPAAAHVAVALTLPLRNQAQLQDFVQHVTTPGDPLYGHYLTPQQFAAQYGPTPSDYEAVVDYLKAQGLSVRLHPSRTMVGVSGQSADIERAFHVQFNQYRTADGRTAYANTAAPLLPASVAARVNGVVGLDNLLIARPRYVRRSDALAAASPNLVGTDSSGGLTPTDIKRIYNLETLGLQGEGQSIALAELDGYNSGDIRAYIEKFNLPIDPNNTAVLDNILTGGYDGSAGGNQTEVVLDIDMALALIPRAERIYVYESPNDNADNVELFQQIADDHFSQTVSFSYGIADTTLESEFISQTAYNAYVNAESAVFLQMSAQGQSCFVAAGDNGAYTDGATISVSDPAQNPYVTAVGGTSLSPQNPGTADIGYGTESSWGEPAGVIGAVGAPDGGGGGGFSNTFPKPYYQYSSFSVSDAFGPVGFTGGNGAVASDALLLLVELAQPTYPARDLPDVSLNADPQSGYAIFVGNDGTYYPNGFEVVGGTSAASPLWAAFTCLVNEARAADSLNVTPGNNPGLAETPVGFINPLIYQIGYGRLGSYNQDLHDIYDLSNNLVFVATSGFDDSTGWGSFNGGNLLNELGSISTGAVPGSPGGTSGSGGTGTGTPGTGGTTVVTGTVTFGGAAPTGGLTATVTATATDGTQTISTTTNSTGQYTLSLDTGLIYTFTVTANGYVTQSVAGVDLTASTLTENFNLTSRSSAGLNTFPSGMQMISEPYDYSSTGLDFAGLFGIPTPIAAGGPALYLWQPEVGSYAAYPNPPADALRPGFGYWLFAPAGGLTPVVQGTTLSSPFVHLLQPGWNQIGDPFTYSELFSNITVDVDSLGLNSTALTSGSLVSPTLYSYNPSANQYVALTGSSAALSPYAGYWLYAYQSAYLTFH